MEVGDDVKRGAKSGFALFDLTIAICFFIALISAISSARRANAGFVGYAAAVVIGVVVGTGMTTAMWYVHEKVGLRITKLSSESSREWCFGALLLMPSLLLIPASAILADWVTSQIATSWR
jgi:uncharacterized membrane-anchored protein